MNNNEIFIKYLDGILKEINRLKSLGCSDKYILNKIQNDFRRKLGVSQTKNCNRIIEMILKKKTCPSK